MKNKNIIVIDLVLIVGTLILLGSLYSFSSPVFFAPETDESVLVDIGDAEVFLIDDDGEFNSPEAILVEDGVILSLEPGFYYWKYTGTVNSEIGWFQIETDVELEIRDIEGRFVIVNIGEESLDIDVYQSIDDEEASKSFVLGGNEDD